MAFPPRVATTTPAAAFVCFLILQQLLCMVTVAAAAEFDPYVLNGGLVAAVAGRDYVVLATDTRLAGNGYDILERNHISSRLWSVSSSANNENDLLSPMVAPDGSLLLQSGLGSSGNDDNDKRMKVEEENDTTTTDGGLRLMRTTILRKSDDEQQQQQLQQHPSVCWIASTGCQSDCEQLKRTIRAHVRQALYFGEITTAIPILSTHQISVLLSNVLYSRRSFPYYSFCLVAGIGQVFVYDAIGSYEQVAAACTGTGRELLQPILDRQFQSITITTTTTKVTAADPSSSTTTDDYSHTNVNNIPSTQVDCPDPEEAIQILLQGYRSVSEREIGVGDSVVFLTIQKKKTEKTETDGGGHYYYYECKIWSAPLKKH